jgi:O-antigen ligase
VVFGLLWVMVLSIPLENQLLIPGVGLFSHLMGVVVFVAWTLSVLATGRIRPVSRFHVATFVFLLWAGVSLLWTPDAAITTQYVLTLAQLFLLTIVVWDLATSFERIASLLQAFVLGALIGVGQVVVTFLRYGVEGFFRSRATVSGFNPNDVALLFALALPMAWFLATSPGTSRRMRLLNQVYIAGACLAIPLTGSRSGVAAGLALLLLAGVRSSSKRPGRIIAWAFVSIALFVGLTSVLPQFTLQRLQQGVPLTESGNLSGRGTIWKEAAQVFWSAPITGVGAGAFVVVDPLDRSCQRSAYSLQHAQRTVCTGSAAHNVALTDLAELGIVGFLFFAWIVFIVVRSIPGQPSRRVWLWGQCLAVWFIAAFLSPWELEKAPWLLFVLIVASSAVDRGVDARAPRSRDLVFG